MPPRCASFYKKNGRARRQARSGRASAGLIRPGRVERVFNGVLQVDGYAVYRALAEKSDVQLAFCWAHVRRRLYELAAAGPAPIASEALQRIVALYEIEKGVRGRGADERRDISRIEK